MQEQFLQDTTTTRRAFLGMGAAALPFSARALQPGTAWENAARWLQSGRIGTLRTIYIVLPASNTTPLRQQAEEQLQEMRHALGLPAPLRQSYFQDQKTCMLLLKFPNTIEATLHLSPAPPPGPETTLQGTHGRIEMNQGIARLLPLS